jgi:hypothetical protein
MKTNQQTFSIEIKAGTACLRPSTFDTATAAAPFQSSARRDQDPEDDVEVPRSLRLQLQSPEEAFPLHLATLPNI